MVNMQGLKLFDHNSQWKNQRYNENYKTRSKLSKSETM